MSIKEQIFAITRPSPKLLTLYAIHTCLIPPISFLAFPLLFFRYSTMRYEFDEQGISMSWGLLWKKQVNLTYKRIQDIHVTSGVIQRWLGLADLHIQTASGSSQAEMKLEGILEYEALKDFIYSKMRGSEAESMKSLGGTVGAGAAQVSSEQERKFMEAMQGIAGELRASRQLLEQVLKKSQERE